MTDTRVSRRWFFSVLALMFSLSSQRIPFPGVDAWVVCPPVSGWTKLPIQSFHVPQIMVDTRFPVRFPVRCIRHETVLYGHQGPPQNLVLPLSNSANETQTTSASSSKQSKKGEILDKAVATLSIGSNATEKAFSWMASCIANPILSRFSLEHMDPFETPEYQNMSPLQQVIFSHRLNIQIEQNWSNIYSICAAFLFSLSAFNAYLSQLKNFPPPGFPSGDQVLYDEGFGWIMDDPFLFTVLRTRIAGYAFGIFGMGAMLAAEHGMTRRDEETNKLVQQLRWMKYRKEQKVQAEMARDPNYDPGPSDLLNMDPENVLKEIKGDQSDFISRFLETIDNIGVGDGVATPIEKWASNTTNWIVGIGSKVLPGWISATKPSEERKTTSAVPS